MAKNVIKQVIIALLLCVVVAFILAFILYQYIPSNALVPAKVEAYSTPENIAREIADSTQEQTYETTNTLLEVTDSDLSTYKSTGSYNPGKSDPFAEVDANEVSSNTTDDSDNSSSSSSTSTGSTNNTSTSTTDNYYHNAGISKGTK